MELIKTLWGKPVLTLETVIGTKVSIPLHRIKRICYFYDQETHSISIRYGEVNEDDDCIFLDKEASNSPNHNLSTNLFNQVVRLFKGNEEEVCIKEVEGEHFLVVSVSYLDTIYTATNLKYLNEAYVYKNGDVLLNWANVDNYQVFTTVPNYNKYEVLSLSLKTMNTLKNLLGL